MRKKFDPVSVECWNLRNERCHSLQDEDEKYHRWLGLWSQHLEGRNIDSVSLERAEAILSLGAYLASMTDRHTKAVGYLDTLLSHPDIGNLDPVSIIHHRSSLIWSLLHIGNEHRVVEIGQPLLNMERNCDKTRARNSVRTWLGVFMSDLEEAQQKQIASPELTNFVWSIALLYKRRPVRRQLPDQATYEQLINVLRRTHPPRER